MWLLQALTGPLTCAVLVRRGESRERQEHQRASAMCHTEPAPSVLTQGQSDGMREVPGAQAWARGQESMSATCPAPARRHSQPPTVWPLQASPGVTLQDPSMPCNHGGDLRFYVDISFNSLG